ncbi:MAG: tRNA pseudouridine(55) synthase TruB [Oscillospiraceae bacterium]|nr:tRNA pseudouridine(55) synthase TruB [Oscillospiraceae bacterium]
MNGIICVYKPNGFTSFDVIAIMRRLMGTKKIGHSGTLDPMAEGVLPIFVGTATKAVDFCPDTDKSYRASFKIGITTDTQDVTGTVTSDVTDRTYNTPCFAPRSRIIEIMEKYTGEIEQIPPMYSAVKVNGKRLYDIARKGGEVERTPRKVTVHSLELEDYGNGEGVLLISCSKGTYVRTIIHDIGQELGFGAVMTALQRTRSNGFTLSDCHDLAELRKTYETAPDELLKLLKPVDSLFKDYPKARLDEKQTKMFRNGVSLNADLIAFDRICDGVYAVTDDEDRLCALAKIERDHTLSIIQRFNYE